MTDSFVTQCPHCQTSFRVSHAQLSVARGVVRCGACLQVFNAARQLLEQRSVDEADITPPPGQKIVTPEVVEQAPAALIAEPLPEPTQTTSEDDDPWKVSEFDLDNLDLDEELARLEQREIQLADNFGKPNARNNDATLTAQRDHSETEEGTWVGSLRNDDVSQLPEIQAEVVSTTEQAPEPEHEDEPEQPSGRERTEPSLSLTPVDLDDDQPALSARKQPASESTERWSARDDDEDDHDDDHEPTIDPRGKRARNEPAVRDQALLDLTDDPLQLDWQRPKPRWGRRLLWSLLVLLALAGLAGQYIWYHFDHLARQDQYRPWFQQICPKIDCKVPSKVDINLLKSSNLVVRSHPEFQGALVVDAIIYNRASFSQPFPLLELRFADTSGQLIASRRFKPGEYLSGEMAGKEEMPPQTPIHIALDILDPGAKAVNYSLNFRSPE
ncbi:DUF3426 domain-containing protein [Pseudomonas lijiangensis]|uniref:DUF3426 domain-containing protein n=1 Tax=Pseudomonas lijiangensis TaxID=2995658 RepID=A0ABX8HTB0_9PSED|nr:DUF3426 domain-containing protein [Pseudomonas lijiangensis]MBX8522128.1 DUF3426 domain-containing protein [Pseudomonas cichorii]MBX8502640.1 DUF3426 domain-containing protein [Pseudomonas lijiangensis]MBX8507588.1 DUF3426 domain-containing protein [Pseudomonas lijiangensis]MBX8547121.1 DUF3426 domain-containing protein [Pseudomonas cichorii]MBX8561855.1 DUF3426 domain-containing protein [Pseudomonas cichorii]